MNQIKTYDKIVTAESISSFKKSLAFQRERFKSGKDGTGINNFDLMCDALENIKSDLKYKIKSKGRIERVNYVEKIIKWYRTLESNPDYLNRTPEGLVVEFPKNIAEKINRYLTNAYEIMIEETDLLGLLE